MMKVFEYGQQSSSEPLVAAAQPAVSQPPSSMNSGSEIIQSSRSGELQIGVNMASMSTSAAATAAQQESANMPVHSSSNSPSSASQDEKTTLWMGDLDPWMDENFIKRTWGHFGEQVEVKMIRDKFSGMNAGYCFVDFGTHQAAVKALMALNGTILPGTNKIFKLNWASGGGLSDKKEYTGPEYSIFVGDLGPEVNDDLLFYTFQRNYPSCRSAKVVTDAVTGLSRGYGFVRFTDELEQQRSMVEMQGIYCGSRPMRISAATPKNRFGNLANWNMNNQNWSGPMAPDLNNTTVFVGGLTNGFVTEEEIATFFAPFGPITYVKIPPGKGCGFVSYVHRQSAEQAIAQLNGSLIGNNRIRLSWGRNSNPSNSQNAPQQQPQHPMMLNQHQSVAQNPLFSAGAMWKQQMGSYQVSSPPSSPERLLFASSNGNSLTNTPSPFSTASSVSSTNDRNGVPDVESLRWPQEAAAPMPSGPASVPSDPSISRPTSSFANPLPSSSLGYRTLPSLFRAMSAPASPEPHQKNLANGNLTNLKTDRPLSGIWN